MPADGVNCNMSRNVPFAVDYKTLSRFERVSDGILYGSLVLSLLILLIDKSVVPAKNDQVLRALNNVNVILAIAYFLLDLVFNYLFQSAESKRRHDFFDNSLHTSLADQPSTGYFSNDGVQAGMYKMGLNCFENAFFTKKVASKMLQPLLVKLAVVVLAFLFVMLFTDNRTLTTVLQLALPFTIIEQSVRLFYFRHRVSQIFEQFKTIMSLPAGDERDALILHNVISYDATLSWATIKLDENTFHQMNPLLTGEWERFKLQHQL